MTSSPLIERVFEAFADDLNVPPALTLRAANAIDSYDAPLPPDETLDAVNDDYIKNLAFWGLPHLDAGSWRYYLPHLVSYVLRRPDDEGMVPEALVQSLRPPDRFPPRLGSLTAQQEAVVREVLEVIGARSVDAPVRDEAQRALAEWWLPTAFARPTAADIAALRAVPVTYRHVSENEYRFDVPDTLTASGVRDLPSELRHVQTWGGYVCGDVHMMIAVNVLRETQSPQSRLSRYAAFFGVKGTPRPIEIPGARRALRHDGQTPIVNSAGHELVVMLAAETKDTVTLTMRAAVREDVRDVMERVAASLQVSS